MQEKKEYGRMHLLITKLIAALLMIILCVSLCMTETYAATSYTGNLKTHWQIYGTYTTTNNAATYSVSITLGIKNNSSSVYVPGGSSKKVMLYK